MFSKDQQFQIEKTSAHMLSHGLISLVKDPQHTVNLDCQGWWLVVKKGTKTMVRPILK